MLIRVLGLLAEERRERWHTTHAPSRASRKIGARAACGGDDDVDDSRAADFQEFIASRGSDQL
jgi:hypothetical protein